MWEMHKNDEQKTHIMWEQKVGAKLNTEKKQQRKNEKYIWER